MNIGKIGVIGGPTPFQMMIMESQKLTDTLIKDFEILISTNENSQEVLSQILNQYEMIEHDITDLDKKRFRREVEKYLKKSL
jgi:hypothetical protein